MFDDRKETTRKKLPKWLLLSVIGLALLAVLAAIAYQIPSVHTRFDWRVEIAQTYLQTIIHPIRDVPTTVSSPLSNAVEIDPQTPAASPTAQPTQAKPVQVKTSAPTAAAPTSEPLPEKVILASPPFEGQDWNNCGPVSLSMYLNFYGWDGDQYDISDAIKPLRADRNVNVDELAGYAYDNIGWLNVIYRVGGDIQMLRSLINLGIPVMVEESMRLDKAYWNDDDLWAGHYLLITGYDDTRKSFMTQDSFIGPDHEISYLQMDTSWQAFNRVFLLLYPPEKETEVIRILGDDWNVDENRQNALLTAQQETKTQPDNIFAWFNLGSNLVYFERYGEAAQAYDQARTLDMPQRMLRYQFGPFLAYFHGGRNDDLLALTEYALSVTPNSEEALLWQGWGLYRSDSPLKAIESFEKALENNPNYADAQYAIQFVQGQ